MNEYGMNEFEMIKKADVMRIINGLQTTPKSGARLINADEV